MIQREHLIYGAWVFDSIGHQAMVTGINENNVTTTYRKNSYSAALLTGHPIYGTMVVPTSGQTQHLIPVTQGYDELSGIRLTIDMLQHNFGFNESILWAEPRTYTQAMKQDVAMLNTVMYVLELPGDKALWAMKRSIGEWFVSNTLGAKGVDLENKVRMPLVEHIHELQALYQQLAGKPLEITDLNL